MEMRLNCVHEGKTDRIWEFFWGDIGFFDEFLDNFPSSQFAFKAQMWKYF